jgi:hypothetical protein
MQHTTCSAAAAGCFFSLTVAAVHIWQGNGVLHTQSSRTVITLLQPAQDLPSVCASQLLRGIVLDMC